MSQGDFESSLINYKKAIQIAELRGDRENVQKAKCSVGIANANMRYNELMTKIRENISVNRNL